MKGTSSSLPQMMRTRFTFGKGIVRCNTVKLSPQRSILAAARPCAYQLPRIFKDRHLMIEGLAIAMHIIVHRTMSDLSRGTLQGPC